VAFSGPTGTLHVAEVEGGAGRILTEDEQTDLYTRVVSVMGGRPVTVRLLDFGADKVADFLEIPKEENPCLGFRGARLLLQRTDVLIPQARALVKAARVGPVQILYPMITDLKQFLKLREIVRQHTADIEGANVQHGPMFEVPSACLDADAILDAADFASIGSNDLFQYLFAVDRNNEMVAQDYNADHPVFWRMLEQLASAAKRQRTPLSLCGEVGGDASLLPKLIAAGITSVSVSARLIGLARMAARRSLDGRVARHARGEAKSEKLVPLREGTAS